MWIRHAIPSVVCVFNIVLRSIFDIHESLHAYRRCNVDRARLETVLMWFELHDIESLNARRAMHRGLCLGGLRGSANLHIAIDYTRRSHGYY